MTSPDKPLEGQRAQRVDSGGATWAPKHVPNPASSPVPPGFSGGQGEHHKAGDSSSNLSGPPGFVSDTSGDRSTFTSDMLQSKTDRARNNSGNNNEGRYGSQTQEHKSNTALPAEMAHMSGGRSSSFVNLAAVLGTGLAESMDDATKSEWGQHHTDDLSLARQSRHAAARLIGASPPRVDPLGLDAGSGFLGGGAAAPATLGGLHLTRDFQPAGTVASDSNATSKSQGGSYLSGAFHNNSEGLRTENNNNRREYSPLSMFGPNANRRGNFPVSKDVGVTVMEPVCMNPGCQEPSVCNVPGCKESPSENMTINRGYSEDSGGVLAALMGDPQEYCTDPQCPIQNQDLYNQVSPDRDTFEVERGMRTLWTDDGASLGGASRNSRNRRQPTDRSIASSRSADSQSSRIMAEAELRPFLWDTRIPQHRPSQYQHQQASVEPSRCIAILKAMNLQVPDIRSACEAFGVIETFRSDFADRGIIFVSYYDLRSAQYAALDLEMVLRRRAENATGERQDVTVYYCVPLNSSTQTDESRLILSDVPQYVDERSLLSMLSSYGAVRSLRKHGGYYGGSSYEVEFNNVQDAKQAILELSSTQPWGPDVAIEVGMRPPIDRKRGRELLSVIGRWRHGSKQPNISPASSRQFEAPSRMGQGGNYYKGQDPSAPPDSTTQLVLGPDGRYSYVVVDNRSGYPHPPPSDYSPPYGRQPQHESHEPPRQQIVHGPNGEIYITTVVPSPQAPSPHANYRQGDGRSQREYWPSSQGPHSHYSGASYHSRDSRDRPGAYYSHHGMPEHRHGGHHHHHSHAHPHGSGASTASVGGEEKDNKHLVLDLDSVESGRDVRTSLMVRNIPNKYTQQMLLAEFTENGLGPGVIDFFYLPIDFKNRCNRGYAFINFVDFKDILPFHRRYFGKHWSTFNSDKICDITYARIQGKAAMLKRFENSALMEKDEEYKPLVFISHGPEKGKRIPFPEAAASANAGKP